MMPRDTTSAFAANARGLGLIEALATLAIGLFIVVTAVTLHARTSTAARVIAAHARMHETARLALAVIESDARMAGFWGLAHARADISVHPLLTFPPRCGGSAWVTDFANFVDGTNNGFLSVTNCAAASGGAQPGADVLIVRRASARPIELSSPSVPAAARDELLLISTRAQGQLFLPSTMGGVIPPGYPIDAPPSASPPSELRSWRVDAYYVSVDSSAGTAVPALRRKLLVGGPTVSDEEIAPGVEDLQFRIGADVDGDGQLDGFFEPGTLPGGALPVCLRVWLRVREIERSGAGAALRAQSYADRSWPAINDGFGRVIVSRTIELRNARR